MEQELTYFDLLEECADTLTNIKEGASPDQLNPMLAEVALRCVEEKIAEVDDVLHKMQNTQVMQSNLEYVAKKLDAVDIKLTKLEQRVERSINDGK